MYATPSNNYWKVGDQPSTVRWSSAAVAYVADSDSTYLAWLAEGYETSEISTELELADLLNETYPEGSPLPAPPPSTALSGPISISLVAGSVGLSDTNGNYTVPDGVYKLLAFAQAAGGGGGNCTGAASQAGGGGGAGETRLAVLAVSPGDLIDYQIGTGALAVNTANDLTVGLTLAEEYPVIAASNSASESSAATTHNLPLPASIAAGDLLVVFAEGETGVGGFSTPSGWTNLYGSQFPGSGGARCIGYWKIASGSEGATVTCTTGTSARVRSVSHRITGHDGAAPSVNLAVSTSTTPDPPNITTGVLAHKTLWLVTAFSEANLSGVPSGFTFGASDPDQCVRTAWKHDKKTTVQPGTFSQDANTAWAAGHIAVMPATPSPLMRSKGGTNGTSASGGSNGTNGTTPTGSGGIRIEPTAPPVAVSNAGANAFFFTRGGSSWFGQGGTQTRGTTAGGVAGGGYGGGGSGGGNGSGTTAQSGGTGAAGMVLFIGFGA